MCGAQELLSDKEMMALMLAALFHDIDHPGLNNAFLVGSRHKLALRYSNKSGNQA